jgi:hypothetical protein
VTTGELDPDCMHGMLKVSCVFCNGSAERVRVASQEPAAAARSTTRRTPENSPTYFGHRWPEWFQMRDTVLAHIEERARRREKTTYSELWSEMEDRLGKDLGNPLRQLPSLLGWVGVEGFERTHLVITALVVYEDRPDQPGDGFFRLAAELGDFPEEDAPKIGEEWPQMTEKQKGYWEGQVEALFAWYGDQ